MNRRTFVAAAGTGLAATGAGCLSEADPTGGTDPSDDDGDDVVDEPDDLVYTVSLEDALLEDAGESASLEVELIDPHVEPDSPAALEATLSNTTDGTVSVSSGAPSPFGVLWAEPADGGESITLWTDAYEESGHVGTDGKHVQGVDSIGLVEDLEGGESVAETFEIHEETPGLEAGTYEASVSCGIEPDNEGENEGLEVDLVLTVEEGEDDGTGNGDENVVPEDPRVDEPPHEPEKPETPDDYDEDEWNDDYLGEGMPEEPSLEFEVLERVRFEESALSVSSDEGERFAVHLIESEADRDELIALDRMDAADREPLEGVDFDERALVVVESGFGSGSVSHRWKRVEDDADGVHCHGYYVRPFMQTDDYTSRVSAVVVDRPADGLDLARVSLTVDTETRIHVNSTEGAVSSDESVDTTAE